nr:ferritin-like protein [Acidobacteriota bacterium]
MSNDINTRAQLIDALRVASELEHQLMAQYLFAVYSLKRYTWEGLDPVQLEFVRRWSSSITLIARQEMEHLGLAINLLSAIGGTPSFTRPNMPQREDYYGRAAGIKLELTRGDLDTIKRFQRFEAPDELTRALAPGEAVDQERAVAHCQRKDNSIRTRADLTRHL